MEPEKTDEKVINAEEVDETELDKELEESLNSVKAGNELTPNEEVKTEEEPEETEDETPEDTPDESEEEEEEPKSEDPSTPPVDEAKPEEKGYDYRIPNKGKFESDESFEKRIELMDLVKKRKLAKTDEQRQEISNDIKTTKNQLKTLNGTDKIINPLNESGVEPEKTEEEDEYLKADKERLKALGGATREDIQDMLKQERLQSEVRNTVNSFVERHKHLKDEDAREVFFDFVDNNYNWQNKSGKELMTVLELAQESMFKPSETIQERVLKGADVQNKVNAMQFPGGTVAKQNYSPEMTQSIKEMTDTGMTEEKALELLSDDE